MRKIFYIFMGIVMFIAPLTAYGQVTTGAALNIGASDANGNSTFSQSSTLNVPATDSTPATSVQFQTNGIYGCNQTGAAASSVGSFASSGVYVPVADAAVELNTGYLVYLACSLRPLVSALSASASASLAGKTLTAYTNGNNGNPQFSVNIPNEQLAILNQTAAQTIPLIANAVSPAFRSAIQTSLARSFAAATQNPTSALSCPYTSTQMGASIWTGIAAIGVPTCDVLVTNSLAYDQNAAAGANAVQNYMTQLNWGQGTLPITTTDAYGNVNVVTPGAVILSQANQALQAGLTKTENANDIGQMVSALFAGIGAQAVSSAQGLIGITNPTGSPSTYISQVVTNASQSVAANAVNTAITDLNSILTSATSYQNALATIANAYLNATNTLRGDEAQCWNSIIQNVCVAGSLKYSASGATCTEVPQPNAPTVDSNGQPIIPPVITLTIATSSSYDFAQPIINANIAQQSQTVAASLTAVNATLTQLNALGSAIANSTAQAAQSAAMAQLDALVASPNNGLPTPATVQNEQQYATSIPQTLQSSVITTAIQNWEGLDSSTGAYDLYWNGSLPPNGADTGWCNYTNQNTLSTWENVWKNATGV